MPQMMPMKWIMLMFFFLVIYILIMSIVMFMFKYKLLKLDNMNNLMKINFMKWL